jgi:hypothetical protein
MSWRFLVELRIEMNIERLRLVDHCLQGIKSSVVILAIEVSLDLSASLHAILK